MNDAKENWHNLKLEEIFKKLKTNSEGLSQAEAEKRVLKTGLNKIPTTKPIALWKLFLRQFQSPLMYIVLLAGFVSLFLGHYSDTIFIFVVILINVLVSFYQENKADKSLRALEKMVRIKTRVLRDGLEKEIDSEELALGDIVSLRLGDKVPADCRLIDESDLTTNESALTGEFIPVKKKISVLEDKVGLADQTNMVFLGTTIESGRALAVVVSRGLKTEFGQVVSLLREVRQPKTPLQRKIETLSKFISLIVLGAISLMAIIGIIQGQELAEIFLASIALVVSIIPEGLLPAVTVVLVIGMQRILRKNGLVRRLVSAETLGSVSVICTDKTGTITEGVMSVGQILTSDRELFSESFKKIADGGDDLKGLESHIKALEIGIMSNEAFIENPEAPLENWVIRGLPTEVALVQAGIQAGLQKYEMEEKYPLIKRQSFSSINKYSASLHQTGKSKQTLFVLGAPERIIDFSKRIEINNRSVVLSKIKKTELDLKLEELTKKGLRVVACARRDFKDLANEPNISELVKDLTLVGFIAIKDPLRLDAKETVADLRNAKVRTVLITGDHLNTAKSIALEVGILKNENEVITGPELDKLNFKELKEKVNHISVYARVSPTNKLDIVKAFSENGEVVAMVGDGVNDAPALRSAHIGISVGSGTDVAKEASDLVLLDNSLKTVLSAIEQGRLIFDNIRKVLVYLLADDFSELFIFFGAIIFGLPLPLLPAQILWINFVEDGTPSIALTAESETKGLLNEAPRKQTNPILDKRLKVWLLAIFFIAGLSAFGLFALSLYFTKDLVFARTLAFTLMIVDSIFLAYSIRSFKLPIWRKTIFNNHYLTSSTLIGFALLILAIYLPTLNNLLKTTPLGITTWFLIFAISLVEIYIIDWVKIKLIKIDFENKHTLVWSKIVKGV